MSLLRIINQVRSQQNEAYRYVSQHRTSWKKRVPYDTIIERQSLQTWNYSRTGGRQQVAQRPIRLSPTDTIYYSSSQRRSFAIARVRHEFKEISDATILVKRTTEIWNLSGDGSWSRVQRAQVDAAIQQDASQTIETITIVHIENEEHVGQGYVTYNDTDNNRHWAAIGPTFPTDYRWTKTQHVIGDSRKKSSVDYIVGPNQNSEHVALRTRCVELRGLDAQLWNDESVTIEKVMSILNPVQVSTYSFPSPRRKKDFRKLPSESIGYGRLNFYYLREEFKTMAGDNLQELATSENGMIVVSIPTKCALSFPDERGNFVAKDISPGIYAVEHATVDTGSIYDKRLRALLMLDQYRLQIDVTRYDYLTVMDIDLEEITDEEFNSHRVGTKVDVDTDIVTEGDSLFDRLG